MKRPALPLAAALAAALVLALSACGGSPAREQAFNGDTNFRLPNAPSAELPAWGDTLRGEVRPLRPAKGNLLLLFFGFTSCPDVCPTTMSALGAATRSLPPAMRSRIEAAMVTVDPRRDSGPDTAKYVRRFFRSQPAFGFRTANRARLAEVEKAFGAASEIAPHQHGGDYEVTHTSYRYAVDDSGKVVLMWPYRMTSDQIAADLKVLLGGNGAAHK